MKYKLFNLIDDGFNHGLFKLKVGGDRAKLVDDVFSKRKVNIVSNTTNNNGVESFIFNDDEGIKNCITIATRGNDYYACYQDNCTITIVRTLLLYTDKFELNKYIGFYLCTLIRKNKYKSAYGRVLSGDRLKQEKILLPINKDENPDWEYIEDVTKKIYTKIYSKFDTKPLIDKKIKLEIEKWEYFIWDDIFKIKKGKRLTIYDQDDGSIPYISSSSLNNGVDNYISNGYTDENCLSFACYGSIGYVFYHSYRAWVSDNCNVIYLRDKKINKYIAMFIKPILELEKYRFSYGMTAKSERLKSFRIKLPAKNNKPDFEFMENYIKSINYSSVL